MANHANEASSKRPDLSNADIVEDYRTCYVSRQASIHGRKEVMAGNAKFGIFGDGKEVAQVAMARSFQKGDWRSGYYRDQTFMFALGGATVQQFFAQLFADSDPEREPHTGGRQMNSHFASRYVDPEGKWLNQLEIYNSAADASPTASQMSRLLGLGYASKLYREQDKALCQASSLFSRGGNEVAFGTIGNASTAEGIFWECFNGAGVLQVPIVFSIWDDGYGISVPNKFQMTKESISEICAGFAPEGGKPGIEIYTVEGWSYPNLVDVYRQATTKARQDHQPSLIHVYDMTQPLGHSTSGSHERYKTAERMEFEQTHDCLKRMRQWMIENNISDPKELDSIEQEAVTFVEQAKNQAWNDYLEPIKQERDAACEILATFAAEAPDEPEIVTRQKELQTTPTLLRRTVAGAVRKTLTQTAGIDTPARAKLQEFAERYHDENAARYRRWLHNESDQSPLETPEVAAIYPDKPEKLPGAEVINRYFDSLFAKDPRVFVVGEDIGHLGGVNQGFKGLQEKYGENRVTDTGIREATILGQGIGAAMRGLRPIVDIQYLDYLLYCFQVMSDDLATLHYRSAGGQLAPCIIRSKGHRLEGIWHTGSPMGMILHGSRGIHVAVPRNCVQAAGLYNTLMAGDDPALVIEVLNGYRVREPVPSNLTEFNIPLGVPEVLREGTDVTVVTYGACVRIAESACAQIESLGISVELIDVQTLLPFDRFHRIGSSVEKTGAVVFFDEDVPGGASAFMLQHVLETQKCYDCLDAPPRTLTAEPHRSAYASDADYWCKPSAEDLTELVYDMMHERDPQSFPTRA